MPNEEKSQVSNFWSLGSGELLKILGTRVEGLASSEAAGRLHDFGPNLLEKRGTTGFLPLLLNQFRSPLVIILLTAAIISFVLGDQIDAIIIISIVLVSSLLGFWQEYQANNSVQKLIVTVQVKATVVRQHKKQRIPFGEIVPGDIILLAAGSAVPADSLIIESHDLFVDEAALTGESMPAEKESGAVAAAAPLQARSNSVFMGTHVVSGSATVVAVKTGSDTEFGQIARDLKQRPPETEFEQGIRKFGFLLTEITLSLLILIFAINILMSRPVIDSFLFSLALAVGITPELLPAIITITMARGARLMASRRVIVKRLAAIEDFGAMNVLCSDKTGTLTRGKMQLDSAQDISGKPSDKVMLYAYLNAKFESAYTNPIDRALLAVHTIDVGSYQKLDEVPYDFTRKRLSILVRDKKQAILITKGAFSHVLQVCTRAENPGGENVPIGSVRSKLENHFEDLSRAGLRTLAVAYRDVSINTINKDDEKNLIFLGFLVFVDPPKKDAVQAINRLRSLGITPKIITGDNVLVAGYIAEKIELGKGKILTGPEINNLTNGALRRRVKQIDIFAEVEPQHKERIILALMGAGNVVGYLGDGINDATALHTADVGISVDSAVDVAKEAADIVLLEKDLDVLADGVEEGRRTFSNTLKYIFMTMSANFGNMLSMAGASLFLPFLPLLPKQILLTNLLTDVPAIAIATDRVDPEMVTAPTRWRIAFIRKFMIVFGLVSSAFDFLTFGLLIIVLHAGPALFQTAWFIESCATEVLVVLVIRSRRFLWQSRPGRYLLIVSIATLVFIILLPYLVPGNIFGFETLPLYVLALIGGITMLYLAVSEVTKRLFYRLAGS